MLVRDFAIQLLTSPNLEDKLFSPKELSDFKDNTIFKTPDLPGRCELLSFAPKGRPFQFSEFKMLRNDEQRARCLHFFANHELQAIELMALALLKFPDAPEDLRMDLVSTIQDEQKHTKLYLNRMKQSGLEFGDDELNRFFWDALKDMTSIEEFIAGMSLTLEQANLDFAFHFQKRFRNVGDHETSKVLKIVLEDEMKHVKLGLDFFKHHQADENGRIWNSYCGYLKEPLFPSRAKSHPFQKKIRQAIGFHREDIEALQNYQRSKGRPPDVFVYNSFAHDFKSIKKGQSFRSSLDGDFQFLPLWLSKENDILAVHREPSKEWLQHLRSCEISLPEITLVDESKTFDTNELNHHHITEIHPWSPCSEIEKRLENWNDMAQIPFSFHQASEKKLEPDSKWQSYLYLKKFYETTDEPYFGKSEHTLGIWIDHKKDLGSALQQIFKWGYSKAVLKSNFGCAGQSVKMIEKITDESTWHKNWISDQILQEGKLWVQPFFNKLEDLSLTGRFRNGKLRLGDLNFPITSQNGRHYGHVLRSSWSHIDEKCRRFILGGQPSLLEIWNNTCEEILAQDSKFFYPNQNLGIDTFIYEDLEGNLSFHPLVELNNRTTFGHLAHKLSDKISSNRMGLFLLIPLIKGIEVNSKWFEKNKVELSKWSQGIFLINDPHQAKHLLSICVVSNSIKDCIEMLEECFNLGDEKKHRVLTPLFNRLKMDPQGFNFTK